MKEDEVKKCHYSCCDNGCILIGVYLWYFRGENVTLDDVVKNVPEIIQVNSTAFKSGGYIPQEYSYNGGNKPIPVSWSNYQKTLFLLY